MRSLMNMVVDGEPAALSQDLMTSKAEKFQDLGTSPRGNNGCSLQE